MKWVNLVLVFVAGMAVGSIVDDYAPRQKHDLNDKQKAEKIVSLLRENGLNVKSATWVEKKDEVKE